MQGGQERSKSLNCLKAFAFWIAAGKLSSNLQGFVEKVDDIRTISW